MINRTVLELSHVYSTLNQSETIELLEELTKVRFDLEELLMAFKSNSSIEETVSEDTNQIQEQLQYIDMNIKTLEKALSLHQNKTFEKKNVFGGVTSYCLN